MDEARCVELGELVIAEELYTMDNVPSLSFCCDECGVDLIPCSYIKNVNLRKPYFKINSGEEHAIGCYAEGDSKVKKSGLTSRLSTKEGFPLAYPNHFKLRIDDVVEGALEIDSGGRTYRPNSRPKFDVDDQIRKKTNYSTTSFKAIVNQYFDFPNDRDRPLSFDGIDGRKYEEIFQKIKSPFGKQQFRLHGDMPKVYYAQLNWEKAKENDGVIKIKLSPGLWNDVGGRKVNERPFYLEIDLSDWPKQSKTKFLNRYIKMLEIVKGTKKNATIAFVGVQDVKNDLFRFYAKDRRLICFRLFDAT